MDLLLRSASRVACVAALGALVAAVVGCALIVRKFVTPLGCANASFSRPSAVVVICVATLDDVNA